MNEQHAILAEGVRQTFGEVVALDGLDLRVAPGTVFGLLGPNGAGKTTFVRGRRGRVPPRSSTASGSPRRRTVACRPTRAGCGAGWTSARA